MFTVRPAHPLNRSFQLPTPVAVFDAHDLKHDRPTLIKIGDSKAIEIEIQIYAILKDIAGIPQLYTWCALEGNGYMSIQRWGWTRSVTSAKKY